MFPAYAGGAGDQSVIAIDDVEGTSVGGEVGGRAIVRGSVGFLGEAGHSTVVVVVRVVVGSVVVSLS